MAVVDPEVGTDRLGLVIESGGQFFVGPDNGLLIPGAKSLGPLVAFSITAPINASPTFHGRDVFAPAASMLALGKSPAAFGPRINPKDLGFGEFRRTEKGIEAIVIYVDRFGNLILNMNVLPHFDVCLKGIKLRKVKTYAEGRRIEPLITLGSHGFAEIAVAFGSAAERFRSKSGDRIELEEI